MKTIRSFVAASILGLCFAGISPAALAAKAPEPAKSVLDNYEKIRQALVQDSLKGVADHAQAIAKAVREDQSKTIPAKIADDADKLAKAQDLKMARDDFKPLSADLVAYLEQNKTGSGYHEMYCPMAKANWIQKSKKVDNPYMGKSMPRCGEMKREF